MAVTQFDDPVLESDGSLSVGGPFTLTADERSRLVGDVVFRFVVVEESDGPDQAMAQGIATWIAGGASHWEGSVSSHMVSGTFTAGASVRAMATAVLVFQPTASPSPGELPHMATHTWCVTKTLAS